MTRYGSIVLISALVLVRLAGDLMGQSIGTGQSMSFVVRPDGKVLSWGSNVYGQLGQGLSNQGVQPQGEVVGLTDVVAVAGGGWRGQQNGFAMALRRNGTVLAWGLNNHGQLGSQIGTDSNAPIYVPGLDGIDQIAAGAVHAVALDSAGRVWAWGNNSFGQLGNGTIGGSVETPTEVTGLPLIVKIVAGDYFTLALAADGKVRGWGEGNWAQLGIGTRPNEQPTPVEVHVVDNAVDIAAGIRSGFAILADGTVMSWGANENGRLGQSNVGSFSFYTVPTPISGLDSVVSLGAGAHSLAVRTDGSVYGWGYGAGGQLGLGSGNATANNPTPVPVPAPVSIESVAVTDRHSIAKSPDGTVFGWGLNSEGQVDPADSSGNVWDPRVLAVQAGLDNPHHTLFIRMDGSLWAAGANAFGQLGDVTTTGKATPLKIGNAGHVVVAARGRRHSLAVGSDGRIRAWGDNTFGQLGFDDRRSETVPSIVPGMTDIVRVAAGNQHSLLLSASGQVFVTGRNAYGQLGDGSNDSRVLFHALDGALASGVEAIAAGGDHSVVLKTDGTVLTSGANHYGQLGDDSVDNRSSWVTAHNGGDIQAIAAGGEFTLMLKDDGTVLGAGANGHGQLGNSSTANSPLPLPVSNLADVTAIAAGDKHALALKSDGTVWAWGANGRGQLGHGTTSPLATSAAQISGLANVVAIYASGDQSFAEFADGTVRGWGGNLAGELGIGFAGDQATPVRTLFRSKAAPYSSYEMTQFTHPNVRFYGGWGSIAGNDVLYHPFVIPMDHQEGVKLDPTGPNAAVYPEGAPWFINAGNGGAYRYDLTKNTSTDGVWERTAYHNIIAAFGTDAKGSPLYVGRKYRFGVYPGSQYDGPFPHADEENPLRVVVYQQPASGPPVYVESIPVPIPRRNKAAEAAEWAAFEANNFTKSFAAYGLKTTVRLLPGDQFHAGWAYEIQRGYHASKFYIVEHEATPEALDYRFVVQGIGYIPDAHGPEDDVRSVTLYDDGQGNQNATETKLYALNFTERPGHRPGFLDVTHFQSEAMPPEYVGQTVEELTANLPAIVDPVVLTGPDFLALGASPELYEHPDLQKLVDDLRNDPLALISFVLNEIDLIDPLAYGDTGNPDVRAVNYSGIARSAAGAYQARAGSPLEQCALLVYLLREAGFPAAYVFPKENSVKMSDRQLSQMLRMQIRGAVDKHGNLLNTESLISVNYPWVAVGLPDGSTRHVFPWLKDYEIVEGLDVYDYMSGEFNSGQKWATEFFSGNWEIMGLNVEDTADVLFPLSVANELRENHPGITLDDIGVKIHQRRHNYQQWDDLPRPLVVDDVAQAQVYKHITHGAETVSKLANIFNELRIEVRPVGGVSFIDTGFQKMADLHNRRLVLWTEGDDFNLDLAPYHDGISTEQSTFAGLGDQITSGVRVSGQHSDQDFEVVFTYNLDRFAQLQGSAILELGKSFTVSEIRPFTKGQIAALCARPGTISLPMVKEHWRRYIEEFRKVEADPNYTAPTEDLHGNLLYMVGMKYYYQFGEASKHVMNLHKYRELASVAFGLAKFTVVDAQTVVPIVDMPYTTMTVANSSIRPDSGRTVTEVPLTDFYWINGAIGSSLEHWVIRDTFSDYGAVSTANLLQQAQAEGELLELRKSNFLDHKAAMENTSPDIWSAIESAMNGIDGETAVALVTAEKIQNATSTYDGRAAFIMQRGKWSALIGGGLNGAHGNSWIRQAVQDLINQLRQKISEFIEIVRNDSYSPASVVNTQASVVTSEIVNIQQTLETIQNQNSEPSPNQPNSTTAQTTQTVIPDGIPGPAPYAPVTSVNLPPPAPNPPAVTPNPPPTPNPFPPNNFPSPWVHPNPPGVLNSPVPPPPSGPSTPPAATDYKFPWNPYRSPRAWGGQPKSKGQKVFDPVDIISGAFLVEETDLSMPGPLPLKLARYYSSRNEAPSVFGFGWSMNVVPYLRVYTEYQLGLLTVNDVSELTGGGEKRVQISRIGVGETLHFRIFDETGAMILDSDESAYPTKVTELDELRVILADMWDFYIGDMWGTSGLPGLTSEDVLKRVAAITGVGSVVSTIRATDESGAFMYYTEVSPDLWEPSANLNTHIGHNNNEGGKNENLAFEKKIVKSTAGGVTTYVQTYPDDSFRVFEVRDYSDGLARGPEPRPYLVEWRDNRGNGITVSYEEDANQPHYGKVTRLASEAGHFIGFEYDQTGLISEAYGSDGRRLQYGYDKYGDLVSVIRPDGSVVKYEYLRTAESHATSGEEFVFWSPTHLLTVVRKPEGRVLENSYDTFRRVVAQKATAGVDFGLIQNATYVYVELDDTGAAIDDLAELGENKDGITYVADVFGNWWSYQYSDRLLTDIIDPEGNTITQEWYDTTDAATGKYERALKSRTDERGLTSKFFYDANGNVTTNTLSGANLLGNGQETRTVMTAEYFNEHQLLWKKDGLGRKRTYHYEDTTYPWQPTKIVSDLNGTNIYENHVSCTSVNTDIVNGNLTINLQSKGLPWQIKIAAGSPDEAVVELSYDGTGLPQTITRYDGASPKQSFTFEHDATGNLVSTVNQAGHEYRADYDLMRRKTGRAVYQDGTELISWDQMHYNENGELGWYDGPRHGPEDYVWTDHDASGRVTQEIFWRSRAKADGTGVEAETGDDLYATLNYEYDPFGNLIRVSDRYGRYDLMSHDAIGRVLSRSRYSADAKDPLATETFTYEPGGLIEDKTDGVGGVTHSEYSELGQVVLRRHSDGSENHWKYDIAGRVVRFDLSSGSYWTVAYDDLLLTTVQTLHDDDDNVLSVVINEFDRRGNLKRRTDGEGGVLTLGYDDLDRVVSAQSPVGETGFTEQLVLSRSYDDTNLSQTVENAKNEKTITYFDPLGRRLKLEVKDSGDNVVYAVEHEYSADHHSTETTVGTAIGTANPIVSTTYTDTFGSPVLSRYAGNKFAINRYDVVGNQVSHTDELTRTTEYTYDDFNRLASTLQPDGALTSYGYDVVGNLTSRAMPGDMTWVASYDLASRMTHQELQKGASVTRQFDYTYYAANADHPGRLETLTDSVGTVSTYTYDDFQRVASIVSEGANLGDVQTTTYLYDREGRLTDLLQTTTGFGVPANISTAIHRDFDDNGQIYGETISIDGQTHSAWEQHWDNAGRRVNLEQLNSGPGGTIDQTYRADGLLASVTQGGLAASFGYNDAGQLNQRTSPWRSWQVNQRDTRGRLEQSTTMVNAATVQNEVLTWRDDNTVNTYTANNRAGLQAWDDFRDFDYNNRGQLTGETYDPTSSTTADTDYTFDTDKLGVLTRQLTTGAIAADWQAQPLDDFGRLDDETTSLPARQVRIQGQARNASSLTVTLDQNELTQIATVGSANTYRWFQDVTLTPGVHDVVADVNFVNTANSLATSGGTSSHFEISPDGMFSSTYDAVGDMVGRVEPGGVNKDLVWDAFGRLMSITQRDGSNNGYNWSAIYDGFGRRLTARHAPVTADVEENTGVTLAASWYDPEVEFLELGVAVNNNRIWKMMGPDVDGEYGGMNGIGGLEGEIRESTGEGIGAIGDYFGNVVAVVLGTEVTDVLWNQTRLSSYGAAPGYSLPPLAPDGLVGQASVWRSRRADKTGFVWMGARYYDPQSGRFISADPYGHAGSPDLYSYALGDPANYYDPDGRLRMQKYSAEEERDPSILKLMFTDSQLWSDAVDEIPIAGEIKEGGAVISGENPVTGEPQSRLEGVVNLGVGVLPGGKQIFKRIKKKLGWFPDKKGTPPEPPPTKASGGDGGSAGGGSAGGGSAGGGSAGGGSAGGGSAGGGKGGKDGGGNGGNGGKDDKFEEPDEPEPEIRVPKSRKNKPLKPGSQSKMGNNQVENKRFKDVSKEVGLSKEQARRFHEEISGQGIESWEELIEIAKEFKQGK